MADVNLTPNCPECGKPVDPSAGVCQACGRELDAERSEITDQPERPRRPQRYDDEDDYDERLRRRPRNLVKDPNDEALSWIVPTTESLWAIAAGYLGLLSCFPFIGLLAAIAAILLGVLALKDIQCKPGRRGAFRAWFGIVVGSLMLALWGVMLIFMMATAKTR